MLLRFVATPAGKLADGVGFLPKIAIFRANITRFIAQFKESYYNISSMVRYLAQEIFFANSKAGGVPHKL